MTLEELRQLADELQQRINLHGPASPEEQLKPFVSGILELAGETYGLEVITQAEAQLPEHNVRPDIAVHVDGLICGHVELKRSGTGAGPSAFTRNRDKKQWEKLKELPNLIYTDGCEWGLYRTGKRPALQPIVRFHDDPSMMGGNAIVEGDVEDLGRLLQDFLRWEPVVPHDLDGLAAYLAPLTRFLRAEVERALRNPDSPVRLLFKEWKRFLMPNATVEHFADNYAQTVVYSMLLARLDGAEDLDENEIIESLQDDHELVARAMQTFVLARDELSVGFDLLTRSLRAFHHGDLLQEMPDLWIYFYEHFIRAYDPKTRSNFGVYYTPREIVDFQVRMADFLIDDRFGKELGFADDGVVFLDPALGTGAYPVSAIRHGLNRVHDLYGAGDVPARANLMAENMYGFEVLMGPYAVAHLRLNRVLNEYGANLGDGGRWKIYLADTLESPNREPPDIFNPIQQTLSDEHESARMVKTEGEITVCLGNPPYDRQSTSGASRKGGWVRDGDGGPQADPKIFKDFTEPVRNAGNGRYLTTIYNDYVYFWRWALWRLFEQQDSGGIITFITPSSYLIGPGFAGMRETMRRRFDELWIVDLEGDGIGTRRTENVFGIKIPVCIAIGIRCPKPSPETPAIVRYVRVRGTKAEKLGCIKLYKTLDEIPWEECPDGWQDPFLPEGEGEFFEWPRLPQLLPWSHSGVMLGRTWPIGETEEVLETRWNALVAAEDEDERKKLFKETRDRKVDGNYN